MYKCHQSFYGNEYNNYCNFKSWANNRKHFSEDRGMLRNISDLFGITFSISLSNIVALK